MAGHLAAGHRLPVDLVRPVDDAKDPGVGRELGQDEVLGDAGGAERLHGMVHDAAGELGYQPALTRAGVATDEHCTAGNVTTTDELRKLAQLINAPNERALV